MAKKEKKLAITKRIQIVPFSDDKQVRAQIWGEVRELIKKSCWLSNYLVGEINWLNTERRRYFLDNPKSNETEFSAYFKEKHGSSLENSSYRQLAKKSENVPSAVYACINHDVYGHHHSKKWDIENGNATLSTYKVTNPVPFMKAALGNLQKTTKSYSFTLPLSKDNGRRAFVMLFGRDKSNNRAFVDALFAGEQKLADFKIQLKKDKLYLLLPCIVEPAANNGLDKKIVTGIDLGINYPIYYAMYDWNKMEALPNRGSIGSREDFLNQRLKLQNQRRCMQSNLKFTNGGRDRKKKLGKLESLRDKESEFAKRMNHKFSSEVIRAAKFANSGTIAIEDLTGIGNDEKRQWVVRNWGYFQLQEMIKYKAAIEGIDVVYVNPKNTSRTCPCCGHVSAENRKSILFSCKNESCNDYMVNKAADYVGALNIASIAERVEKTTKKRLPLNATSKKSKKLLHKGS